MHCILIRRIRLLHFDFYFIHIIQPHFWLESKRHIPKDVFTYLIFSPEVGSSTTAELTFKKSAEKSEKYALRYCNDIFSPDRENKLN